MNLLKNLQQQKEPKLKKNMLKKPKKPIILHIILENPIVLPRRDKKNILKIISRRKKIATNISILLKFILAASLKKSNGECLSLGNILLPSIVRYLKPA